MGPDTETLLKGTCDQTQRPTQRNMEPDTETRSKEHGTRHPDSDIIQRKGIWDQTQRPAQRNMGPDTETHSKEHGTRHRDPLTDIQTVTSYRDPLKGTWNQTQRPTQRKEHGTRHPDSDIIERPTQRNMGPDTETH